MSRQRACHDRLVDPRLGVIRAVTRFPGRPDLPRSIALYSADVADALRFGPWPADRVAMGMAFDDDERARLAAIGETVERYCGNFVPAGLRRASPAALWAAGEPALDPAAYMLFSATQYATPGFPFVPLTAELPVLWAEGWEIGSGAPVLIPASLVYLNFHYGPRAVEPPTNPIIYSGIAAGESRVQAEVSAVEELIERDATMIWWQSGSPAVGLDVDGVPAIAAALAAEDAAQISYDFIQIRTPFDVPVIGCLIRDHQLQIAGLGVACRADPVAAALKAAAEAVALRLFALGLLDPEGDIWLAAATGVLDPNSFKPYRADRRYARSFRSDYRDVIDLGSQAQIYLDPSMHVHLDRILHPPTRVPLESLRSDGGADRHALYFDRLHARGFRAYAVDVTTADVRRAGLLVERVVVPGLYPNSPAAFPFLGGRRLYEEPAALGWLPRPLTENDIVRTPLPHT
jgi:ribosomal protein S12 methylthiotransferase accessory factor